ncbi:MAG: alpha/beta fold hydrolase, partial [Candidatus Dormiibacterota bacterium]
MNSEADGLGARFQKFVEDQRHELDVLHRQIDDLMFFQRLGDLAEIDLVTFTGPPPRNEPNPTAQGAGNPVVLQGYVFLPRELDRSRKQPLLVHPHGGIHANYGSSNANALRELLAQGYTVIAPDFRGSTGYGRGLFEQIDYGGLETEDTFAARQFALDSYPFLDPERVGIVGWSHGGMHALLNIFDHPEAFAAAYVCVPVSDLVARMAYKSQAYREEMQAAYHLGRSPEEDVAEYRRRSPSWQAHRYAGTPLLI